VDELPQVKTDGALFGIAQTQNLTIPAASLGAYPRIGRLPGSTVLIDQGNPRSFITNTTVEQPLTQLIKLRAARHTAQANIRASQADLRKAENEVALQVRQVYFEILIGRLEVQAMAHQISSAEQSLNQLSKLENQISI
jgi:outer membrane protein TolC